MSWLGANADSAVNHIASWLTASGGSSIVLSRLLMFLAENLVILVGEPTIFVLAFLLLETCLGMKLRCDTESIVTWGSFVVFWLIHKHFVLLLTSRIADPVIRFVPEGCLDLGAVLSPLSLSGTTLLHTINFLFFLFLTDFGLYWFHRISHKNSILWKFHAVHHSYENMDALNSLFHPIDTIARLVVVQFPLVIMGSYNHTQVPWIVIGFFLVHDRFVHTKADVGFGYLSNIVCDNQLHFIHHSTDIDHQDSNYATLFPVFDMLFGTYRAPIRNQSIETGIDGYRQPQSILSYLTATLDRQTHRETIHRYQDEERRSRADRKQTKGAARRRK